MFDLLCSVGCHQEGESSLQGQAEAKESLRGLVETLSAMCEPGERPLLLGRREDCLQPYVEAQKLLERRRHCLGELRAFLGGRDAAGQLLKGMRQVLEGAGSWDRARSEVFRQELEAAGGELRRLEAQAAAVDGSLSKARWQLRGAGAGPRTSCRALADALGASMEAVHSLLGTRQSEAEALGALWTTFRQRKEQLLMTLREVEEKAGQHGLQEPSLQALQQRYGRIGLNPIGPSDYPLHPIGLRLTKTHI